MLVRAMPIGQNATEHTWRFPSGATLTFRHLAEAGAERNFQGAEYQFIGVDEVTDLTEDEYRFLFARLRRLAGSRVPLRMRAASNPYGPGLEWCHRRFILEAREHDRVFIPAHLEDNPHLDASYEDSLKELGPTSMDYTKVSCPETEAILKTCIRVTLHEGMSEEYVLSVAAAVRKVVRHYAT